MNRHPSRAIVPYVSGCLEREEWARVDAHVRSCAACADTARVFRDMLDELRSTAPWPPGVHWARYRAELRAKLDARIATGQGDVHLTPWSVVRGALTRAPIAVPALASAALAGVLLFVAMHGDVRESRVADVGTVEETVLGHRLDLLTEFPVIEKLELFEDLEVIRNLDQLADVRGSDPTTPSDG